MQRIVEPEILDHLPADDPEAIRSRRDLRWINGLMGNHRWLRAEIRRAWRSGLRVLELGAGDGAFGADLVRRKVLPAAALSAIDLAPRPAAWPAEAAWLPRDLFAGPLPDAEIVIANLFLHHFQPAQLAQIGASLPPCCRFFLASEPARRPLHLWQSKLLEMILPLGRVTKHDMPISIRAGFHGDGLRDHLRLTDWKTHGSTTFFGAYRMIAHRN